MRCLSLSKNCGLSPSRLAAWGMLALVGAGSGCSDGSKGAIETFRNPPEISSSDGELRVKLTVAESTVEVAGQWVTTTVYNRSYTPPLLRVRPGDTLHLELDNRSNAPTNEHYHGMNVSPRINADGTASDDIFVHAAPGTKINYKVAIPSTHNAGLYWYHSHQHGSAEQQVMGGLSGGLLVEGLTEPLQRLAGIPERVMLLKDIQITPDGRVPADIDSSAPTNRTVNGQTNPTLVIAPGETQLLRIGNLSANLYYRLQLGGHTLYELARDGNRHTQLVASDEILLAPGSRSEVLIQGAAPGIYALKTLDIDTGPQGDTATETILATVVSQGEAREPLALSTVLLPPVEDFRTLPIARKRTITFSESADGNTFFIDSGNGNGPVQFDHNRVDTTIVSGTVEEWTVLNPTGEWHVFHIHQTDFQVVEVDGVPQPFIGHQDNVNVAFQTDGSSPPGQVKLLIDFRNPLMIGKFAYHCHILEHEDGGMMGVAQVVPGPAQLAARRSSQAPGASGGMSAMFKSLLGRFAQQPRPLDGDAMAALQEANVCRVSP